MKQFKNQEAYATITSYSQQFEKLFGLAIEIDTSDEKKVVLRVNKSNLRGEYDIDTHVGRMNHYFPPLLNEGVELDIVVL
ncbi:hypothetical protein [Bernardetia sp.]|uniref:hypothetical protein n=1 Tax=Bernardetia sp. TaxID=1937974 RepID=UPI0025B8B1C3|nr:hypothetical protein [Bernardetia sp.]